VANQPPARAGQRDEQPTQSTSTPHSLLVRVRAHDLVAWHNLIELYGPLVYQWCRREGLQDADAADVGQEVFRSVAAGIDRFRRDRPGDSFRGWLWGITHHKLQDHWRRQTAKPPAEGGSIARQRLDQLAAQPDSDSSYQPAPNEMENVLRRALELVSNQLEASTWKAFWRVAVDGRTAAEVADEMGMTVGAVYVAKSRVLARLREELRDLEDLAG
jgi:RNA polymerase sigma-70 factor (ECF subfamily)